LCDIEEKFYLEDQELDDRHPRQVPLDIVAELVVKTQTPKAPYHHVVDQRDQTQVAHSVVANQTQVHLPHLISDPPKMKIKKSRKCAARSL